jgi:two-component system cell cycle sensor histidine kinase/response regulator CckA
MTEPTEEHQLIEIVANAPWVVYAFRRHPDGRYTIPFASAGIERLFGVQAASLKDDASSLFARVLPEDLPAFVRSIERSAEVMGPWSHEFRIVKEGIISWIEGNSTPVKEQDGAILWKGVCQDVTERRSMRAQLHASLELRELLISQAPISIAMLDRNLCYVAASHRWVEAFGGGRRDLLGLRHYDVIGELPEHWRQANQDGLAGLSRSSEGELWVSPEGVRSWLRWAVHPWQDGEGRVGGIIIFSEDITARKEAEVAVREGDAQLAAIVRSAMDGVITVDEEQRILLVNPAAERMFGYASGELVGEMLSPLLPARYRSEHLGHIRRFGGSGATHRSMGALSAVVGLRSSGEEFPIESSISQVEVGGRKLYTVILRDVSERVRAERALAEEEARFRQLAESIHEVFWLTDVAKRNVIYVSPAYETIWGRTCQSLSDDPGGWLEAVHSEDRARIAQAAREKQSTGAYDELYRVVRPDGTVRWIHDRAFPVPDAAGNVVRIAGVAEDVTERRVLEEQLRQTQKMESIGRLAGGVAHDFNNLLTVIASSAELMREGVRDAEEGAELVQDILDAGRRGATLTRQLLAFTRQEVVAPRVMDLGAVVGDAEKLLRRLLGEDVALVTRLASNATLVRIDPGQWSQVVLNLAVNARDAMPKGGRLVIETRSIVVDAELARAHPALRPGGYATLSVRDEGTGMSSEVRSRIFEPFFTTKGQGKGTGLGLAVVYGVVHQAGGHIEVDTALGRGTTFTIYLPSAAGSILGAETSSSLAPPGTPGTEVILVVEDEDAVRKVAVRILEARGYLVLAAADGEEAVERMAAHRGTIDLLLTDVVLPGLDGPSLAAQVRAQYPAVKVLFASGYIDDALSRRGVIAEGTTFLPKPYTPTTLLQRVREVLDG